MEEEKDAFKTDDEEEMEIDQQAPQKRKKVRWLNPHGTVFFTSSVEQCSKQTGLHVVVELL